MPIKNNKISLDELQLLIEMIMPSLIFREMFRRRYDMYKL